MARRMGNLTTATRLPEVKVDNSPIHHDEGYGLDEDLGQSTVPSSLDDSYNMSGASSGGSMRGSPPRDNSLTNLIVNYLPQSMSQEEFRVLFATKGQLESCKLVRERSTSQSLGYGFVQYVRPEDARDAVHTLNGLRLGNKMIKVSYARPSSENIKGANLYVSGIPKKWTTRELESYFTGCGEIITSRILSDPLNGLSKGVGFVRFDQRGQAEIAIDKFNNTTPPGCSEPMQVKFANNPMASNSSVAAAAAAAAAALTSPVLNKLNFGLSGAGLGFPFASIPTLAAYMNLNQGMAASSLGLNFGSNNFGSSNFGSTNFGSANFGTSNFGSSMGLGSTNTHSFAGGNNSSSGLRSRTSPVGPIHHQTSRVRYSPMTSADLLTSSSGLSSSLLSSGLGSFMGNSLQGYTGSSSNTIFVYNLAPDTQETTLWQLFGPQGCVQNVKIVRDQNTQKCKGYAFVTMATADEAANAIQNLNGFVLGNRVLQVSFKVQSPRK